MTLSSTEEALRESEARYQTLFNSVDEGICILEIIFDDDDNPVDYRFLESNPTFEEQTGLVDAVGKTARELVPDLDEFWFETYGRVALTGESERFEHHAPAMNRWFDVYAVRVGRPDRRQVALFFRDISERKRINRSLRESEQYFRMMADSAPAMLWLTDTNNQCIFLSRGWYEYTGQSQEDGLGLGWADAVHPDDRDEALAQYLAAAERCEPFQLDFRLRGVDGEYRWAIDSGQPRFDTDGNWQGYIGSVIDVDERKKTEQALVEADERKDRFMALLSHELRNPLAPIKLSLQLLDEAEPNTSAALRAREVIERQVDQLTGLVDDLLDVTRVSSGKVQLRQETVALREILEHTVADHRALFEAKELRLDLELPSAPLYVHGDPNRLRQVLGNLLQNAAKFTEPGGRTAVAASVDSERRRVTVSVADTGVGMTDEMLENLFEPFIQAGTSLDHAQGGLGLGLSLVKGLTELHDGGVQVRSDGLGHGAEFEFWLPLAEAPQTTSDVRSPDEPARGRRVLVIDDNVDLAESLATMLELRGHQVAIATTGDKGIARARSFEPELVFCDIGLPGMDGYEVARRIRSLSKLGSVFLVALSGYAAPEDIEKSRAAGFDRHIAKPPRLTVLEDAIVSAPR